MTKTKPMDKIVEIRQKQLDKVDTAEIWGKEGNSVNLCNLLYEAIEEAFEYCMNNEIPECEDCKETFANKKDIYGKNLCIECFHNAEECGIYEKQD